MKIADDIKFLEQGKDLLKEVTTRPYDSDADFKSLDEEHLKACKDIVIQINDALRGSDEISADDIKDLKNELIRVLNDEAYPFLTQTDYIKRDELLSKIEIEDYKEEIDL